MAQAMPRHTAKPGVLNSADKSAAKAACVMTVAGSDPSGGAGIQADLKTFAALKAYGASVLTALTVQNTLGIVGGAGGIMAVPPAFIEAQIEAVLSDIPVQAVKTGMLADVVTLEAVSRGLCAYTGPLVVDPVMVASSGDPLLSADALAALKAHLIARADVITPNIPEAELLTGLKIRDHASMRPAAHALLALGPKAVVLKGGHLESDTLIDILLTSEGCFEIAAEKIHTRHTHGTGCTLASAIAAGLAQGMALDASWRRAHAFVQAAIVAAPGIGAGHGPLGHAAVQL